MSDLVEVRALGDGLFHIQSSSDPELFYEVDISDPDNPTCTCPGFVHRQKCKHGDMAIEDAYQMEQALQEEEGQP